MQCDVAARLRDGRLGVSQPSRRAVTFVEMPLQNRVTPLGELVSDPGRGLVYGNRGCLHDESGRIP